MKYEVQCLNREGELVHHDEYKDIFALRVFTEGPLVGMLARKEVITVLVDLKED